MGVLDRAWRLLELFNCCPHRSGWADSFSRRATQAFDLNVSIGNLAYLYHCLATSTLPSPLSHLMHYPLPTLYGLPEFALARDRGEEVVVTISNYAGPARDYVRAMVEVLGAKFEGTMSRNTSYVVSARCVDRHTALSSYKD